MPVAVPTPCPLCQSVDHDARQCPLRFELARFLDWLIEQAAPELSAEALSAERASRSYEAVPEV